MLPAPPLLLLRPRPQVGGILGADKGRHFVKAFRGEPATWVLATPLDSLPAPGNESTAAPWRGASVEFLYNRLMNKRASVWWQGEQRFYEGRIVGGWAGRAGGGGRRRAFWLALPLRCVLAPAVEWVPLWTCT